ncbi:MAG: hypothetical protein HKN72_05945 [Gemmatimonadetes bacterium]|nr:hypothetical protein [Gemmatimonadota bacterium]NNL30834.1 hypothetical protein [Gemmatimonadota bacterium]
MRSQRRPVAALCSVAFLASCGAKEIPREDWGAITPDAELRVTTVSGAEHEMTRVTAFTDRLEGAVEVREGALVDSVTIRIPLDSIDFVETRSGNAAWPVLTALAATATTIMIINARGKSDVEPPPTAVGSCPFIYSFDGNEYRLDSETFAGAITRGLARTDLDNLEQLRAVDGLYRMRLANERPETQHTDELTLRVVDHPAGTTVLPDRDGEPRVLVDATGPRAATGLRGADVLAQVMAQDDVFWQGDPVFTIDETDPSSFRDGVELIFPRPASDRGLLSVRAQNTTLAPFVLERFLELFGEDLTEWYRRVDRDPALQSELKEWIRREGMLHVSVWVGDGWVRQAALPDVGPHLPKSQVAELDLAGVEGDVVRVRLEVPRGLWSFDHIGLGTESTASPVVTEVRAMEAFDGEGRDVAPRLMETDGSHVTALPGHTVDLVFQAPPDPPAGNERTVLARTHGFYHIWVEQSGTAQLDQVERILREPGYVNRYMLELFRGTIQ